MSSSQSAPFARTAVIGVVGAGTMGVGVAQSFAEAGHPVTVVDPSDEALGDGECRLRQGLRAARLLRRPAPPAPMAEVAARVRWEQKPAQLGDAALVVECGPERIPVKEQILAEVDRVCGAHAVIASCTSAIPVATLAAGTGRPDRVIGTHFMNPAHLKDAVEVIRGPRTSDATLETVVTLLEGCGKRAHVVGDAPGFVSNRVLMPMVNDAAARVQEGTADAETVDTIFTDCFGHAMGPLRTADLIGLDTVLDSLLVLRETTGDARYEPCALLRDLVARGHRGRKSGRGFHVYETR
ncbi:3-hydroxyacyl-CoA dehydrogenase family protein [Streptomyces sp. NL15-2K]|uniref:3-hydroxyacyl-CoA dehydrogenase family protein n=1 Tax=Streptomyces sp. NL15-2K TaxID=376149 RepID=UPI000F5731EB|nr:MULTISPECIES: 3-hydroxyacyl-CoA dehydrogenase family protein [Actinomycetes]WKX14151.1 3-hydroxyacyl-CoA dehydrogenase family protein [Kutzneria buriramensis]GCB44692.1 3-hydroxybutyryl-CoA dehydrogenase [Streptomyces sp. NL15-2K]